MNETQNSEPKSIPQIIFEEFVEELRKDEIQKEIVDRLNIVLQAAASPTEQTIKNALFTDTRNT